jgi:subtilisin family serine protease
MAKRNPKRPAPSPTSRKGSFDPTILDRATIALPLLREINAEEEAVKAASREGGTARPRLHDVVIDLNLDYEGGRSKAKIEVQRLIDDALRGSTKSKSAGTQRVHQDKGDLTPQYVFASLNGNTILEIVRQDSTNAEVGASRDHPAFRRRAIYRIWPDFEVGPLTNKSIATVKADAAHRSFNALGADIVWAVIDSGIDGEHPHFLSHKTLKELPSPLEHKNFSSAAGGDAAALHDDFGHGTHVAGIIAGEGDPKHIHAVMRRRQDGGDAIYETVPVGAISGMAPRCKLLSLRVLDGDGRGTVSNIISALSQIQEWNAHGRRILVHGVNLSVGYGFDAEWFACGQSPLCVEVDRLVKSGVVVVVAAGNTGYGTITSDDRGEVKSGMDLTINDPGNAECAITVGATHRDMPHIYGVSYFSSKGPTGDGRAKPDLVAPGEKILSCAAGTKLHEAQGDVKGKIDYVEDSGTSMAAPHVSGVVAAFLSVRREYIGQPEVVKSIFLSNATDLKRERHFQGHGLVDLMRAIQSV